MHQVMKTRLGVFSIERHRRIRVQRRARGLQPSWFTLPAASLRPSRSIPVFHFRTDIAVEAMQGNNAFARKKGEKNANLHEHQQHQISFTCRISHFRCLPILFIVHLETFGWLVFPLGQKCVPFFRNPHQDGPIGDGVFR